MNRANNHEKQEAHKISEELMHHHFAAARAELQKEASHPHELRKVAELVKHDLKTHHQDAFSVHHDKHGNVTHIEFGKHDIFDKAKVNEKDKHHAQSDHSEHPEHHKLHKHHQHHKHHEHQIHNAHPERPEHGQKPVDSKNPPVGAVSPEASVNIAPPSVGPALDALDGNKFLDPQQKAQIRSQAEAKRQ